MAELNIQTSFEASRMGRCINGPDGSVIFTHGELNSLDSLKAALANSPDPRTISDILKQTPTTFAVVIVTRSHAFLATDRICSVPLFFSVVHNTLSVSNSASSLIDLIGAPKILWGSVAEYLLSGYVHGEKTLYKNVTSLQPGFFLLANRRYGSISQSQYFSYRPAPVYRNRKSLIQEFDDLIDLAIKRTISYANGRPIVVPLSGGLDSRLVLAKLKQHKYPELYSFTYGLSGNHEAMMGQWVAKKLDVPWRFIRSRTRGLRNLYNTAHRRAYADYADGRQIVPSYVEYEPLSYVVEQEIFPLDSVIVNGQSGDFLFGGHVPATWAKMCSAEIVCDFIVAKHCNHWLTSDLDPTREKIKSALHERLDGFLNSDPSKADPSQLMAFYEGWEAQERQPKAAISNQRLYDFLGFAWTLPFWDSELMSFWSQVPYELKFNQDLHIEYLRNYNYRGVFDYGRSPQFAFTGHRALTVPAAQIIEVLGGKTLKARFYEKMFFYTYFQPQLGLFGRDIYKQTYKDTRRPRVVALGARYRLDELSILGISQDLLPYL
jgi:asparagine synthase (glutamine-hydrolysing)